MFVRYNNSSQVTHAQIRVYLNIFERLNATSPPCKNHRGAWKSVSSSFSNVLHLQFKTPLALHMTPCSQVLYRAKHWMLAALFILCIASDCQLSD